MLQSRSRGCLEHVETSCAVADVAYVLRRTHHAHTNAHTQDITCLEDGDGVGKEGVAFHVLAHTSKGGFIVVSSPDDRGPPRVYLQIGNMCINAAGLERDGVGREGQLAAGTYRRINKYAMSR